MRNNKEKNEYEMEPHVDLQKICSPDILIVPEIGPCLGVAFYHTKKREGYIAHIAGAEDREDTYEIITKALTDLNDASQLEITLCGLSSSCNNQTKEEYQKEKKFIEKFKFKLMEYLTEKGCTKITEKYAKIYDSITELRLDAETGEVTVEETDLLDEFSHYYDDEFNF